MTFADVTRPVVINVTKMSVAQVDEYIRRPAVISTGETLLNIGEYKIVDAGTYIDIFRDKDNYTTTNLYKRIAGFFSYAENKELLVFEVGEFDAADNNTASQVQTLRSFIANKYKRCYAYLVPDAWYYPEKIMLNITNTSFKLEKKFVGLRMPIPNGKFETDLPAKNAKITPTSFVGIKAGSKNISASYIAKALEKISAPISKATNKLTTNASYMDVTYSVANVAKYDWETGEVEAIGEGETEITLTGAFSKLEGKVLTTKFKVRVEAWDKELVLTKQEETDSKTGDEQITDNGQKEVRQMDFADLAQEYSQLNSQQYFFVNATKDEDPAISDAWTYYKGKKAVFAIYDNLEKGFPLASMIMGQCFSSKFDLSTTQLATPLNYTKLSGQIFSTLSQTMSSNLIDAPMTFGGSLAGNSVILNARYADGVAWEYYYQWDLLDFNVKLKLERLLFNSVNSTSTPLPYNQTGLDILKANIKSELLKWQSIGVINTFAAGYDINTGELVTEGDISMIDFNTYITAKPENYQNEIYDGFSFYVMIGRFPRQVVISAMLN